jgi:hypothetical protein
MVSRWVRARRELTRRGWLVDSGERHRNPKTGKLEVAWMINPKLSEEELRLSEEELALIKRPDVL